MVRTILGRLRRLPDIKARSFPVRAEAERQAVNTPIQGSAADLIKKAMIDLARELQARKLRSRLILQIHDELLLEVPEDESETALFLVKNVMESAMPLDVPLVVDARTRPELGRGALTAPSSRDCALGAGDGKAEKRPFVSGETRRCRAAWSRSRTTRFDRASPGSPRCLR